LAATQLEPKELAMEVHTSLSVDARKELAEGLGRLQADTFALYLKSHNYHWNVTGPMFRSLHLMFDEQYTELWTAVDEIAERIRSLGHTAPGTMAEFMRLSSVPDEEAIPEAMEMVTDLAEGHEIVALTAKEIVEIAERAGDVATADLATRRVDVSEKSAWMLRATAA
jgi:starvation-inducible DNA-binding protein